MIVYTHFIYLICNLPYKLWLLGDNEQYNAVVSVASMVQTNQQEYRHNIYRYSHLMTTILLHSQRLLRVILCIHCVLKLILIIYFYTTAWDVTETSGYVPSRYF